MVPPRHAPDIHLPADRARAALERPGDVTGDPAAVEVAGLRHDLLLIHEARIHARWVEREMSGDGLVSDRRSLVDPRDVAQQPIAGVQGPIRRLALVLTPE